MKQKIERTNTSTKRFSTRTIALILSIVMLIGSIATGSMLSTFAAYLNDAASADAVTQAASKGGNIALNAIPSEDGDNAEETPDLSGLKENEIVRGIKDDLAGTGANADISSVGDKIDNTNFAEIVGDFSHSDIGNTIYLSWSSTNNRYEGTAYLKGSSSSTYNYYFKVKAGKYIEGGDNNWESYYASSTNSTHVFSGASSSYHGLVQSTTSGVGNDTLQLSKTPSEYVKVTFRFWANNYSSNSRLEIDQEVIPMLYLNGHYFDGNWWSTTHTDYPMTYDLENHRYYKEYTVNDTTNYFHFCDGTSKLYSCGSSDTQIGNSSSQSNLVDISSYHDKGNFYRNDVSGKTIRIYVDLVNSKAWYEEVATETTFYLRGWLNGADYTNNDLQFTKVNDNKYTLTGWAPSADHGGYQYATIWDGTNSYHPENQNDANGAEATETKSDPSGEYKWKVGAVSGQTVDFTWERADENSNWALSWTVSGGGGSGTGSWKYTGNHTDATPEQTGSAGNYRFVWANNDNGPGTSGTTAITPKMGGNEYWADITSYCKSNNNFYFALSNNSSNSGIRGQKANDKINSVTKSGNSNNNTVTMTNGTNTIFYVEFKERDSISGSAYYMLVRGVDWTKITNIGVSAAYTGSGGVDYKFYYKEKTSGGDEEVAEATLYAKDGAIVIDWDQKGNSGASGTSGTAYGFSAIADTTFTKIGDTNVSSSGTTITSNTEWKEGASVDDDGASYETAKIAAGKTIKLKTTIDSTRRTKYYVKGWSINGTTYKCDGSAGVNADSETDSSTGECELTFTIPSKLKTDKIEITPIYYLRPTYKSTNNITTVTFFLEGYNTVQDSWGTTPYIYPFYGNLNNVDNSFGVYPGQPMVYAAGQYSIEIPMTNTRIAQADGTTAIKGITINNGYADHVHRNLVYMWSDHDNDADHKQTYDYDDFAKIYYECVKGGEHPNSIIFRIQDESKVFNRAEYGGGKSGQFASGTDDITLDTIESTGNGWELLTNRYGEAVNLFGDHSAVSSIAPTTYSGDKSNAVYVVSTGYNANIAGDYGTMWKVYDKDGNLISNSGGRVGIPPSLLLLNGTSSAVSPLGSDHYLDANRSVDGVGSYTDKHSDYYDVYKALKKDYAGKIVYITYEQNAQDTRKVNTGTGADRVDGRWYYTHAADNVQSNIEIEVYNKTTGLWEKQTTTPSTGADTIGNKAVFDSDSYKSASEQTTSNSKLISSGSAWNFTATATTGYMFDSWQLKYSDTSYDPMEGTGASGSIPATANYTLVARFMPVVTGELTITHALSNSSTGEGTVNMTVTKDGISQTVNVTNGVARSNLTVSNSEGSKVITVTLTATPLYDGKVNSFGYDGQLTLSPAATETNLNTKATAATSTFSFTVAQLYAGTTQTITDLAYTSLIEPTPHYYEFTYSFASRGSANNDKSYTAKGEISLKDYKNNVSGSHELSDAFIKSMAPFESNFLKKLTLGSITKSYSNDTFTATASYNSQADIPIYNVTFKLPYDYCTDSATVGGVGYKKYNATSDGTYNESKPTFDLLAYYNEFVTISATDTASGSQTNVSKVLDSNDPNHTGNNFITAPEELTSASSTYYFKYWEIRKKADSNQANAPLVSRIYYPDFHYRIFGNYYVEAIYSTEEGDSWRHHYSGDQGYNCSIIYLGDSRNQWNDKNSLTSDSSTVAADKIYNDFIFSYNDNGDPLTGTSNKLGMIIERVIDTSGDTDTWATGDANISDMSTYQAKYGAGNATAIAAWLNGGDKPNQGVLAPIEWNTSELNNKNYTEQKYSFYSAYGQKVEDHSITFSTNSTVDNFVYRAYAYMQGSDGNYYVSDPVYFCMRYTANLNYTE